MPKYTFSSFWVPMTKLNNCFKHLQDIFDNNEYCENLYEADVIIVNYFIHSYEDFVFLNNTNKTLIGFISEPIQFCSHDNNKYFYGLYLKNKFTMVFGCINEDNLKNYYKYPLYLLYYDYRNNSIYEDINNYVKICNSEEKQFCTLINSHDSGYTRTEMYNQLSKISNINCPSKLFNNCSNDELNSIGSIEYIKKFKFNICSESYLTNVGGYITEKLLNCCLSGAIPVYCGCVDDIDYKIFNKNRIIFYNSNDSESINNAFKLIENLMNNVELFTSFYKQDVFTDKVYNTVIELENKLKNGFSNYLYVKNNLITEEEKEFITEIPTEIKEEEEKEKAVITEIKEEEEKEKAVITEIPTEIEEEEEEEEEEEKEVVVKDKVESNFDSESEKI
jgi:hypothetical protein